MTHPTDALRLVPVNPNPGLMSVISAMVRRLAVPVGPEMNEVYFDNGDARQIYKAIIAAAPASPLPGGGEAEFEIIQNEEHAASVSGLRDRAYAEAKHYAAIYGQDGPVEVFEVIRRPVPELSFAAPTGAKT